MTAPSEPRHPDDVAAEALMTQLVERIHDRLDAGQADEAAEFARQYWGQVAPEDIVERSLDDLYGAALSHWRFARVFAGGAPKLHLYNPRSDEHGWQSTHTVIEIVNDDMPFLVDSITMEVNRQGLTMHLIVHPVMKVRRDGEGRLQSVLPRGPGTRDASGRYESLILVEVDRRTDPGQLKALEQGLLNILADVRKAVRDWEPMRRALKATADDLRARPPATGPGDLDEEIAFLQWLADDHFTLIGQRDYEWQRDGGATTLAVVPGSGLGILSEGASADAAFAAFAALPDEVRERHRAGRPLLLTKSSLRSTVHRPGQLDFIGVKRYDADGQTVGERRFLGLFTSVAYSAKPADIPLLRRKVAAVTERAGFLPRSHTAKALATILDQYPRDELFQIEVDELFRTAMGILRLGERQRTRLFVHRDAFGRFASCLVYVPREHYNTELRTRMQALLMAALDGQSSEFSVQFTDSPLARVLIVVHSRTGAAPAVDVAELERRLVQAVRRWEDELRDALVESHGEERGNQLHDRYAAGFAAGYRDDQGPRVAVHDIELLESLDRPDAVAMNLYRPLEAAPGRLRFKLLRGGELAPLSQSLPMIERMGVQVLEERPYEVQRRNADGSSSELWVDDFALALPGDGEIDLDSLRPRFQETLQRTWRGDNDNDDFNRLVLVAGLDWRGVSLLRAYMRYMRQAGFSFTRAYIQQAVAAHPAIAADLVALFHARFDPDLDADRAAAQAAITARIEAALENVANLDEDRILRHYLAMIGATLRSNFFQRSTDGEPKPVLSFKFDGRAMPGLPEPRPMFEIFVSSPRIEGVHLRFGKVARGGLRWSDRMEDYRTEILGLVKAQQVKNVVIVPVGSKGGFVVRQPPPASDREAFLAEGVACYRLYLGGLLDLTDNLVGGQVVPPERVVRHDEDDPYLVVAADKGTATFSDIANATATERGFWLGDAFASGGSVGYDHKKMGITARGAWESVKTHFRSLGHDTQTQDFTVVGVGDMSGDVFGNGMLLSRHIRLVAAFDHRHLFVDPNPDAAIGFAERERLFALPRSSWADYDATKISAGGGVWPRSAKSIPLSAEMRAALGIADGVKAMTPAELMRAILLAPVDLFYNGGIGTYIKASSETHADCGDRANDAIRVDGRQLRCKVVAEGGNLGATQRGRIEFALEAGLVNTDAIDNSAGVDCSDHEVNIKILLNGVAAEGEITGKQRDRLLAEMTDDVAQLCLRDNTFQNQVLAVLREQAPALLGEHERYMRHLVSAGRLNRAIEFLPDDDELVRRRQAHIGLAAPELAVLLAYHKMELYDQVLASDVPEDPFIATALLRYFPDRLRERFAPQIVQHPLRREIIATHVVNSMVNRVGPTFVHRLQEETGAAPADIVRAYLGAREIFELVPLWLANEALDHQVPMALQNEVVRSTVRALERSTVWLLHHRSALADLDASIRRFQPGVARVGAGLEHWMTADEGQALQAEAKRLAGQGVPEPLARRVAGLEAQTAGLDIVEVAERRSMPVETVAGVYFGVGGRLALGWLSQQAARLPSDSHWQSLARVAMRNDVSALARELASSVLEDCDDKACDVPGLIEGWSAARRFKLERSRQLATELQPQPALDLAMLSVLVRELRQLV